MECAETLNNAISCHSHYKSRTGISLIRYLTIHHHQAAPRSGTRGRRPPRYLTFDVIILSQPNLQLFSFLLSRQRK